MASPSPHAGPQTFHPAAEWAALPYGAVPAAPPWPVRTPGALATRLRAGRVLGAAVAVVLMVTAGGVALSHRQTSPAPQALGHAGATHGGALPGAGSASAAPTPSASARASTNAADAAYGRLVLADMTPMEADFKSLGDACSSQTLAGCRAAAFTLQQHSNQFIADLNKTAPPDDLVNADDLLHQALSDYASGAGQLITGLDAQNSSQITAAANLLSQGDNLMAEVATALGEVPQAAPQTQSAPI